MEEISTEEEQLFSTVHVPLPVQTLSLSLQDAWSDQKGQLHLDAQQDYQLLQVQRTPDGLSLLFKRPFVTCDPKDYLIEVGCPVQEHSLPEPSLHPTGLSRLGKPEVGPTHREKKPTRPMEAVLRGCSSAGSMSLQEAAPCGHVVNVLSKCEWCSETLLLWDVVLAGSHHCVRRTLDRAQHTWISTPPHY